MYTRKYNPKMKNPLKRLFDKRRHGKETESTNLGKFDQGLHLIYDGENPILE